MKSAKGLNRNTPRNCPQTARSYHSITPTESHQIQKPFNLSITFFGTPTLAPEQKWSVNRSHSPINIGTATTQTPCEKLGKSISSSSKSAKLNSKDQNCQILIYDISLTIILCQKKFVYENKIL